MESKKEKNLDLSSVQELVKDSWKLFQNTAFIYIKLLGLAIACLVLCSLIGILIALPLSFTAFSAHFNNFGHLTTFPIVILILFIIWVIICLVGIIVIGLIFPIVSIFIFQQKKATSLFDLIQQSKRYLLSYFLTSLLSSIVVFGGVVLFIIPGFLISVFFSFVGYEVILEKKSGKEALQRSYTLVKNHFWEIIIRVFVLEFGLIVISSILTRLAGEDWLLNLVKFLFSVFSFWYARAYFYLLYKQLHDATTISSRISLRWIWIVSGVGWALIILTAGAFAFGAIHIPGMIHPQHRLIGPHTPQNAV